MKEETVSYNKQKCDRCGRSRPGKRVKRKLARITSNELLWSAGTASSSMLSYSFLRDVDATLCDKCKTMGVAFRVLFGITLLLGIFAIFLPGFDNSYSWLSKGTNFYIYGGSIALVFIIAPYLIQFYLFMDTSYKGILKAKFPRYEFYPPQNKNSPGDYVLFHADEWKEIAEKSEFNRELGNIYREM